MPPELLSLESAVEATDWLREFLLWFAVWTPLVAFLEYATHRWIMHWANRLLDPRLAYLKDHGAHHLGDDRRELVDMPLKNCLLLTSPVFVLLAAWGLAVGPVSAVVIPAIALIAWSFVYSYLWTGLHRAIHGTEHNWLARSGSIFRYFRNHHLKHHVHSKRNYGTLFPVMDYLCFTWFARNAALTPPQILQKGCSTGQILDKTVTCRSQL